MSGRVDQGMALAAARLIDGPVDDELRTRYRQVRAMLHSSGLAATYAFLADKGNDAGPLAAAYRKAAAGICGRLWEKGMLRGPDPGQLTARDVLEQLGDMSTVDYARASREASELAGWLSRLADALHEPAGGHR